MPFFSFLWGRGRLSDNHPFPLVTSGDCRIMPPAPRFFASSIVGTGAKLYTPAFLLCFRFVLIHAHSVNMTSLLLVAVPQCVKLRDLVFIRVLPLISPKAQGSSFTFICLFSCLGYLKNSRNVLTRVCRPILYSYCKT